MNTRNELNGSRERAVAPPPQTQKVHIEFTHATARSVAVVGTFNNWRADVLDAAGEGRWIKDLHLSPGVYEYCLVLDGGRWVTDPQAAEKAYTAYGVFSVLKIPGPE